MLPLRSAQKISHSARGCRARAALLPLRFLALAIHLLVLGYGYSFYLFRSVILFATVIWTWIRRLVYDFCAHCAET
jgi:hypothetical protein